MIPGVAQSLDFVAWKFQQQRQQKSIRILAETTGKSSNAIQNILKIMTENQKSFTLWENLMRPSTTAERDAQVIEYFRENPTKATVSQAAENLSSFVTTTWRRVNKSKDTLCIRVRGLDSIAQWKQGQWGGCEGKYLRKNQTFFGQVSFLNEFKFERGNRRKMMQILLFIS